MDSIIEFLAERALNADPATRKEAILRLRDIALAQAEMLVALTETPKE